LACTSSPSCPYENKSYSHSFANEGIPTYVRVVKDIMTNEKVQTMTPEEDCEQTRQLCAKVMELNDGKKVTLNGTCQGGYICADEHSFGQAEGCLRCPDHQRDAG
jgi:hypothetical protein